MRILSEMALLLPHHQQDCGRRSTIHVVTVNVRSEWPITRPLELTR